MSESSPSPIETSEEFLDQISIVDSDRYTGNEGDSFVFPIGKHQYTRGNICIDGESYEHGIEGWLARWNGSSEESWAYAVLCGYNVLKSLKIYGIIN